MIRPAAPAALALAIAAIGGCGDDLVKASWFHASDRMHVRAYATATGYRYAFGWHDRELDVTCAADARACAPQVAAYFADASCRQIVATSPDELPPIAMYIDGANGDGHGLQILRPFDGPVYAGWRGCVLTGETDPGFHYARAQLLSTVQVPQIQERAGGTRYLYAGLANAALADPAAVEDAEALGQVQVEDGPGRLRTRYLLDDDVALAAGILDVDLDTPCRPGPDVAGDLRCLPPLQVPLYREAFADAGCTQAIAAPLYRHRGFAIEAGAYVAVDAAVTGGAYVRVGAACLAAGIVQPWRASGTVEPAAFEPMTIEELGP